MGVAGIDQEPTGRRRLSRLWDHIEWRVSPYVFISPFFIIFLVFGVFTVSYTAWVSLHDWHIFGDREFVGMANYSTLMSDPRFWRSVQNTFSILLMSTLPQMFMALVLAELLNARLLRAQHLFRSALLIPSITSTVAIVIVFQSIFGRHYGLLNAGLQLIGMDAVNWHASRPGSHFAIATMANWQWTGYYTLIFLAAMQSIPRDYHEAAEVDGANRVQRWWYITLPQLRPAVLFASVLSVIGGLQLFAQPLMFGTVPSASGGSDNQYLTILLYLFDQAFNRFRFGYASAIAWTLVVITALTALVVFMFIAYLNRREDRAARAVQRQRRERERQREAAAR